MRALKQRASENTHNSNTIMSVIAMIRVSIPSPTPENEGEDYRCPSRENGAKRATRTFYYPAIAHIDVRDHCGKTYVHLPSVTRVVEHYGYLNEKR